VGSWRGKAGGSAPAWGSSTTPQSWGEELGASAAPPAPQTAGSPASGTVSATSSGIHKQTLFCSIRTENTQMLAKELVWGRFG